MISKIKKPVSILLVFMMIVSLFAAVPMTVNAASYVASVTSNGTTTNYTAFGTAVSNWTDGSTLTLLADVQTDSTINVTGTQTLDLNGHGIKMTAVNQTLFDVTGDLTLNDSDTTKIHKFDPPSGTAGLATLNEASGSLEIHGGYITGFKGNYNCYVIHIPQNARCTMNGGNLIGNEGTASGSNCSVVVGANGDFTMNGGAIIYNKSGYWGAAFNGLRVTINGGTIAHNYSAENCGAVHCHYLTMTGGSITDNYAAKTGQVGGITVAYHAEFSGNPIIKNNTNPSGAANSIYTAYSNNTYIAITEPLGENACIGITGNPGVFTNSSDTSFNDPTKFFSDNSSYTVGKNAAGQLLLGVPRTVTWKMDDGSVIDTTTVANGGVPTHADPTKEATAQYTYNFTGWTPEVVAVTGDAEYTATFSNTVNEYTITWKNDDGSVIDTTTVAYGEVPTHADPTKEATAQYTYTFTGWDTEPVAVTGDAEYTATFTAVPFVASVTADGTTTKYTDFGTAVSNWTDGSTLTLLANVTTSSVIYFESGVKTLDLNGYGIKNTSANYVNNNSVIYIRRSGTQLTLQDSRPNETTHYFTAPAGNAGLATDISDIDSGDQQSFHGGYLTGGNCFSGGGIRVDDGANLIMTGGTIIGNRGTYGGGIDVEKSGSVGGSATISGGAIMYNYGTNYNGAIHTNNANYVSVSNCKITNNYAEHGAGGAYKSSINGGFSGNLIIKDNKTGNTECNVLIESNQYISLTSALGENASIGITMNNPGVFTNSSTTDYNVASKFKSDNVNYKVVKNAGGQLELVSKFFAGHTVTLGGDIGVNFYLNPAVLDTYNGTKTVKFTCDGEETTVDVPATPTADGYKVTRNVVAAQMAHTITATLYVGGEAVDTDEYSVREYAEKVFANPEKYDSEKSEQLKALAQALLNYGAMAQTVFDSALTEKPELANKVVGNNGYADVTAEQITAAINGTASDLNEVAEQLGAKYYTNSLIYLSKNTLRIYFTPTSYPGEIPNAGEYDGNLSGYYYYVDHADIPAAELDNQQTFNVNGTEFTFSALDYAKAVVNSGMGDDQKNLAKALYLYNQKANAYFDAAPAQNIVDLSTLEGAKELQNGDVVTGELKGDYQITIADGATVTLRGVDITRLSNNVETANFAGITPLGDATIMLEGENTVKGGYEDFPGVFVPVGKTLTIDGTGSLDASSNGYGCGIGAGNNGKPAGNIVINGGTITAIGGDMSAGIGGSHKSNCGDITITGGTVYAESLGRAPGIGAGHGFYGSRCGNITISGGSVTAIGESYGSGIGTGLRGVCGAILITAGVTQVTATKGEDATNSIGAGVSGTCGTVTIEDGANVIQN